MKTAFSDYSPGAGVATDLVNTSPLVRRSTGEALPDPPSLARFLEDHGVCPDALADGRAPYDDELAQVHALRDELRSLLETRTEDELVGRANALITRAATGPALHRDTDGRWQWYVTTSPGTPLVGELAVLTGTGLLGALRTLGHGRFRPCSSPVCDGVFVDTSRAGRRRYCMPDLCGNRLNVARHRARRLSGSDKP